MVQSKKVPGVATVVAVSGAVTEDYRIKWSNAAMDDFMALNMVSSTCGSSSISGWTFERDAFIAMLFFTRHVTRESKK